MVHILVVEDDKNTRKLMEAVLKRDGYSVHTAEDGVAALALLDVQYIDLIVLDVMMSGMDGYALTR
ncbi:MAG: response regulator, partial [Bacillota bacterium]